MSMLLSAAVLGGGGLAATAPVASARVLALGSHGKAVKRLQRKLHVPADGAFGRRTKATLKRYQRAHGLTATGRVDVQTAQALGLRTGATVRGPRAVSLTPDQVEQVQTALGVDADGEWGPASAKALKAFEAAHGLPADGKADAQVLQQLGVGLAQTPAPSGSAQAVVAAARALIGTPYASGGTTPAGFDCSGLTRYVFRKAGIKLPRTSFQQYTRGTPVPKDQIQAGDLVFFDTAGGGASHVGVATGRRTAISATSHGVMQHSIVQGYWGAHYVGARRVAG